MHCNSNGGERGRHRRDCGVYSGRASLRAGRMGLAMIALWAAVIAVFLLGAGFGFSIAYCIYSEDYLGS